MVCNEIINWVLIIDNNFKVKYQGAKSCKCKCRCKSNEIEWNEAEQKGVLKAKSNLFRMF